MQGDEAQRLLVQAQPGFGAVALPLDPFAGLVEGHPAADARAVHVQTEAPRLHRMVALRMTLAAGPSERKAQGWKNMGFSPVTVSSHLSLVENAGKGLKMSF